MKKRIRQIGVLALSLLAVTGLPHAAEDGFAVIGARTQLSLGLPEEDSAGVEYLVDASAGEVREGMILVVYRKYGMLDPSDGHVRDMTIRVGRLRVTHVDGTIAVARILDLDKTPDRPMTEPRAVLVGDLAYPQSEPAEKTQRPAESSRLAPAPGVQARLTGAGAVTMFKPGSFLALAAPVVRSACRSNLLRRPWP